jgi:hypothetical protein
MMTLDPALLVGTVAVNQLVGVITDGNGSDLALTTEVSYSPQYYWPVG